MVGIEPPSRMKIGFTVVVAEADGARDSCLEAEAEGEDESDSVSGSALDRMGSEVFSMEGVDADLASVLDVGTGAVPCVERLRAAALPEEVVVDVITRSTCEARLSEESFRRSWLAGPVGLGVGVARPGASFGTGY